MKLLIVGAQPLTAVRAFGDSSVTVTAGAISPTSSARR